MTPGRAMPTLAVTGAGWEVQRGHQAVASWHGVSRTRVSRRSDRCRDSVGVVAWETLLATAATYGARKAVDGAAAKWKEAGIALAKSRARIAFTGQAGAGKTLLFDYVNGSAYSPDYKRPGPSKFSERTVTTSGRRRRVLTTVPGDEYLQTRQAALSRLFPTHGTRIWQRRRPVVGVVHVVSFGLLAIRSEAAERDLVREGVDTIERLQISQLEREVADLNDTLGYLQRCFAANRKPAWLTIAVTKVDLYPDSIVDAEAHYSLDGASPFVERLRAFRTAVGFNNVRVDVLPVCSRLENFEFNGQTLKPALDEDARNGLVSRLRDHVVELAQELT
jgi:hypothetical protein